MEGKEDRILILDPIEKLRRVNPWTINIIAELNKVIKLLHDKVNFFIAGIAVENSSFIYKSKVLTILTSPKRAYEENRYIRKPLPRIPKLSVAITTGRPLIDITELLERINEIIERKLSTVVHDKMVVEIPIYYDEAEDTEKIYSEISRLLVSFLKYSESGISIIDIFDTLSKYRFSVIFIVLLMMYMNNEIDFQVIEKDGEVYDIKIQLYRHERVT